ncbi:MAG TPA: hypothetical protein VF692_00120, partial [Pyrinomonadaceae bacterium]
RDQWDILWNSLTGLISAGGDYVNKRNKDIQNLQDNTVIIQSNCNKMLASIESKIEEMKNQKPLPKSFYTINWRRFEKGK